MKVRITIEYDPKTGNTRTSHPTDVILSLGLLERAKLAISSKLIVQDGQKNTNGLVVAQNLPIPQ